MKVLVKVKKEIEKLKDMLNFLGFFLEGPFMSLDPASLGAFRDPNNIARPLFAMEPSVYVPIVENSEGTIVRWMGAPDLPGAMEFGRYIKSCGIIPCIGHSSAKYCEVLEAIQNGYSCVTHLYSAMSTVTRKSGFRSGGIIENALLIDDLDAEIICDGCHLPPVLVNLAIKIKGYVRLMMVSDSNNLAGMPEGEYEMQGMKIIVEDSVAKLSDRS